MLDPKAIKKVQGNLPTKRDCVDWSEHQWLQFLHFITHFTNGDKFYFSLETINTAVSRSEEEDFWSEFLYRIDRFPGKSTVKQFQYRFLAFSRVPLSFLKQNPHAVSQTMYDIMVKNPRMEWVTRHFKSVDTDIGAQIVVRDNDETLDPGRKNVTDLHQLKTPEIIFQEAQLSLVTLYKEIIRGIPRAELKNIPVSKRIELANQLGRTLAQQFSKVKPTPQIFQQININKGGRDELESAIIAYQQDE